MGKTRYVREIVLTFSSALDPTTASNAANYSVTQATSRGTSAVKPVRVRAIYKPANHTVKLTLAGKPRFASGGQLLLIASGPTAIASSSGVPLEGNTGNTPGSDGLYTIPPNG
jgi:hypothetical protein